LSHSDSKPQTAAQPGEFPETVKLSPAEEAARKRRNLMIALGLFTFIALIFVTTVVRMSSNYNAGA
jgi:hypothetical protein